MFRMYTNGSNIVKLACTHIYNPTSLAYDWIHDNIYWSEQGTHSNDAKIEVLHVANKWRRTLFTAPDVDSPTVLMVDPRYGQR